MARTISSFASTSLFSVLEELARWDPRSSSTLNPTRFATPSSRNTLPEFFLKRLHRQRSDRGHRSNFSGERTLVARWFESLAGASHPLQRRSAETNFCLGSLICGDCKPPGKVRERETRALPRVDRHQFAGAPANRGFRSFEDKYLPVAWLAEKDRIFVGLRQHRFVRPAKANPDPVLL